MTYQASSLTESDQYLAPAMHLAQHLPSLIYDDEGSYDELNASCGGATSFPFLCYEQRECFGFLLD